MIPTLPTEIITEIIKQSVPFCTPYQQQLFEQRNRTLCNFTLVNSIWKSLALEELVKIISLNAGNINQFCSFLEGNKLLGSKVEIANIVVLNQDFPTLLSLISPKEMYGYYIHWKSRDEDTVASLSNPIKIKTWAQSLERICVPSFYSMIPVALFGFEVSFPILRRLSISSLQITLLQDISLFPQLNALSIEWEGDHTDGRSTESVLIALGPQIEDFQFLESLPDPLSFTSFRTFFSLKHLTLDVQSGLGDILDTLPSKLITITFLLREDDDPDTSDYIYEQLIYYADTLSSSAAQCLTTLKCVGIKGLEKDEVEETFFDFKIKNQTTPIEIQWLGHCNIFFQGPCFISEIEVSRVFC